MTSELSERSARERAQWNERYTEKAFVWTIEPNRFLVEEAAGLPAGRALDLAAGEARNAVWLAEQGWQALAVDFADVGLDKGRQLAAARNVADKVRFETADLRAYTPEKAGFDLVAVFYLQIPKAELAPIIERAAAAVAPGGIFLLVAHDSSNLANGYGGPQNPDMLYTASDVVATLGDGLAIEKAGTVERPVKTEAGTKVAIDCLVRAKRT
jgi:SAM-dependent methyltransferase